MKNYHYACFFVLSMFAVFLGFESRNLAYRCEQTTEKIAECRLKHFGR